jgi:hypothetical protein
MKIKITLLIFLLLFLFLALTERGSFPSSENELDAVAGKIMRKCSKEAYRPGCYDVEIPKYMEDGVLTMEDAFDVTRIIQNTDKSYLFCHVLGHNIADVETKKDPDKWLDVIRRCPPLACNNGCPHGAIMRKFKGSETLTESQLSSVIPDLKKACDPGGDWNPSELEQGMCYHSMGHLSMYITGADIERSLTLCREIAIKPDGRNFYQTCVQGVFMIIFQGIDAEDIALVEKIKPVKENVPQFCSKYKGMEQNACRVESWPLYYDNFLKGPEEVISFCSFANGEYNSKWCYDTILRGQLLRETLETRGVGEVAKYCMSLPGEIREYCFATVAAGWVQNEPNYVGDSVSLCRESEEYSFSETCFEELLYYSKYSFTKGTDLWKNYCSALPEDYGERCVRGDVPEYFPSMSL